MAQNTGFANTLSEGKVTHTDNLLEAYKASQDYSKPKEPEKKSPVSLIVAIFLLIFLVGFIIYVFNTLAVQEEESPQFESMLSR